MTRMTDDARVRMESYLRRVRASLADDPAADEDEVAEGIREHLEHALSGADEPVTASQVERVLDELGDPGSWSDTETAGWRALLGRLYRGPEDWRLAYLAFGTFVLGLAFADQLWFLLPASFFLARAGVSVTRSFPDPTQRRVGRPGGRGPSGGEAMAPLSAAGPLLSGPGAGGAPVAGGSRTRRRLAGRFPGRSGGPPGVERRPVGPRGVAGGRTVGGHGAGRLVGRRGARRSSSTPLGQDPLPAAGRPGGFGARPGAGCRRARGDDVLGRPSPLLKHTFLSTLQPRNDDDA